MFADVVAVSRPLNSWQKEGVVCFRGHSGMCTEGILGLGTCVSVEHCMLVLQDFFQCYDLSTRDIQYRASLQ